MKTLEGDYRNKLNSILAVLYRYAQDLAKSKEWWENFCRETHWQGKPPTTRSRELALRYVIKWACAPTREGQQSASLYYRALEDFWKKGHSPDSIALEIAKRGGIRKLSEKNSKNRKLGKAVSATVVPEVMKSPSVANAVSSSKRKPPEFQNIVAKFDDGVAIWTGLKQKTRVLIEATIDEMSGSAAQITVHSVTRR